MNEPRQGTSALAEFHEGDILLPVGTFFGVIRRRFWVITLTIVVCGGVGVGFSLLLPPSYEASIKILVGQDQGIVADPTQAINLQALTSTLSEVVITRPVAERVVRNMNTGHSPKGLMDHANAEVIPETQVIEVTYKDHEPRKTQLIANAIGDAFSAQVSEVSPKVNGVSAIVWERATVPQSPVSPNPALVGLIAIVVGTMLGVGLAVLLEYRDDSWRSPEEAEQVSGVPTLGNIPDFKNQKGSRAERYSAV